VRRLLSGLLYLTGWGLALAAALWVAVELAGYAPPPLQPEDAAGAGFRLERGRQHLLHLSGDPFALGFHNARLLGPLMAKQEHTLLDLLFGFAGGPGRAMLLRQLSLFYVAGLDDYLTEAEQEEILGLAEGTVDLFPELGPRYGRLVAYHAIHELSQRYATDNPLACSLVAVGGERGREGHALLARNFDFEGGDVFDADKVVVVVRPSHGYGFISIAWAGMAGVLSGINEHGLAAVINAGASEQYRRVGAPTSLLVRRTLERARTIDEAVAVLTGEPRFVTDIIGLADQTGRVAVLELTPEQGVLREGPILVATNHLETPELAADPASVGRKTTTTTVPRHDRLDQLVRSQVEPIDVATLLSMMRDRSRLDGTSLPLGHRHAIDALIATHSVIFDSTAGHVWVSQGPHTLGPYHGYDVARLVAASTPEEAEAAFLPSLPADPLRDAYLLVERARASWKPAQRLIAAGRLAEAERELSRAAALADHPRTLLLRARIALGRGERAWAERFLLQALEAPPEYPADAEEAERLLDAIAGP
jgi:hypothetical protein